MPVVYWCYVYRFWALPPALRPIRLPLLHLGPFYYYHGSFATLPVNLPPTRHVVVHYVPISICSRCAIIVDEFVVPTLRRIQLPFPAFVVVCYVGRISTHYCSDSVVVHFVHTFDPHHAFTLITSPRSLFTLPTILLGVIFVTVSPTFCVPRFDYYDLRRRFLRLRLGLIYYRSFPLQYRLHTDVVYLTPVPEVTRSRSPRSWVRFADPTTRGRYIRLRLTTHTLHTFADFAIVQFHTTLLFFTVTDFTPVDFVHGDFPRLPFAGGPYDLTLYLCRYTYRLHLHAPLIVRYAFEHVTCWVIYLPVTFCLVVTFPHVILRDYSRFCPVVPCCRFTLFITFPDVDYTTTLPLPFLPVCYTRSRCLLHVVFPDVTFTTTPIPSGGIRFPNLHC